MASSYLVVHVADASVPSCSRATSGTNYYVELRFNGQRARTATKENPVWNQTFRFRTRDEQQAQGDDDDDDPSGGGLNLEAYVYSIDETSNSESVLGKTVVDQKGFDSHSSKAGLFPYDLLKSCSSDTTSAGPPPPVVVNGKLTLKVFHSAADDMALFDIEDANRVHQITDGGVDNLNEFYKFLFESEDQREYGEAAADSKTTTSSSTIVRNDDAVPREIHPSLERGKVVERMQFLYVLVVKARDLPDVDAYGGLDPFVEVSFGANNKGFTKCLKRDGNPEWNKTFAFFLPNGKAPPRSGVDVVVKDGDLVRDDFVGKLYFYLKDIPVRYGDDDAQAQPEPTWHPLLDECGKAALGRASLLLAIWIGSQHDEAYRHAWESPYGPKVYENPRLWCLRVSVAEVQGIVAFDEDDGGGRSAGSLRDQLFCRARLGEQTEETRLAEKTMQTTSSGSYEWMDQEDLVFVAAQPFFESNLQVDVVAASSCGSPDREQAGEVIGQLTIPLARIERRDPATYGRHDDERLGAPIPQWFDLKKPSPRPHPHPARQNLVDDEDGGVGGMNGNNNVGSHMRIRLGTLLDGGYHIGHNPDEGYLDDTRPAERQLWEAPVGRVHLGVIRAIGLQRIDRNTRCCGSRSVTPPLKPYCVAKYGDKWVRTRTVIETSDPVFNEQYTWDLYDISTVLNVGVLDHCTLRACSAHHRIGKVRIRLSGLETGRVYAHAYPLVTLSPSAGGAITTGELHLAVKISSTSAASMLRLYARPALPRMHYTQPLNRKLLWYSHAANMLALRLGRMEPPLREEAIAYICSVEESASWSMRRSKANFFRLMQVLSPVIAWSRWFEGVRSWRNPLVTLLMHVILVLALWFHKLVLPLVIVCYTLVVLWNHRLHPHRHSPSYVDLHLSYLAPGTVDPDELDEEFDTEKTSQSSDDVMRMRMRMRMRYDRLRTVASRIQRVVGDLATHLERIQSLLRWRDSKATFIFMLVLPIAAAALYFVPYSYKLLVAAAGFYVMRHPRLRTDTPSMIACFIRRLPSKQDMLF